MAPQTILIYDNQIHAISPVICRYIFVLCLLVTAEHVKAINFETASAAYQNKNYLVAYRDFNKLANVGDARAQTILGIMYTYGEGVQVDDEQAFYWYKKAAIQDYPPAQFNVGIMLLEGSGTPKDKSQAQYWLEQAAVSGFERASMVLAGLAQNTSSYTEIQSPNWSQRWNLRLPNHIRDEPVINPDNQYNVYRAQLGAMRTIEGAERLWRQIVNKDQKFFSEKQPIFREASSLGRSFIRLQVGPFDTKSSVEKFCQEILDYRLSDGCIVRLTE